MCQDTGLPVVFIKLGNVEVENLKHGVEEGIKKATKEIPIRPNNKLSTTISFSNINYSPY